MVTLYIRVHGPGGDELQGGGPRLRHVECWRGHLHAPRGGEVPLLLRLKVKNIKILLLYKISSNLLCLDIGQWLEC